MSEYLHEYMFEYHQLYTYVICICVLIKMSKIEFQAYYLRLTNFCILYHF